ncbi:endo-beta-1,3-glucanase [Echria macrotheca]|uniref:glucan endo-1,3-beta-D-glucosidase n=1 Tax=Echria macrotheca TaxID=438768 RepID=A0AAJ0F0N7_9PEZI|nr:endo-beta-1,3-glucanase [Echria macrotheca]
MAHRYSFDDEMGERIPLDQHDPYSRNQQQYQQRYPPQQPQQPYYQEDPYTGSPPRAAPGSHPDSAFARLRAQRRLSQEGPPNGGRGPGPYATAPAPNMYAQDMMPPSRPLPEPQRPLPEPHRPLPEPRRPLPEPQREIGGGQLGREGNYPPAPQRRPTQTTVTPGADNFSEAAAGGMAGIALSVAEHNARQSGLDAVRGPDYPQQAYQQHGQWMNQGQGRGEGRAHDNHSPSPVPYVGGYSVDRDSSSSLQGLNAAPRSPGRATPGQRTPSRSPQHSFAATDMYSDDPYQNARNPHLGAVNPHDIEDDGDDGLGYHLRTKRSSMLSLGSSHRGRDGALGGAAAGGVLGALAGRNASASGLSSQYAPVNNGGSAYEGPGASNLGVEKPGWQAGVSSGKKSRKWRLVVILAVCFAILIAVVLGIVFGVVLKYNKSGGGSGGSGSAAEDNKTDLDINSSEIQALMNNKDLHKVFPGVDYTPLNTQYPDCIGDPPSQNNVTRDVAVLSQLTNTLRLYGNDCNQTQMVIHALRQLKLDDKIKIWMGVWQDNNKTTNARQLSQMYDILNEYGDKPFKGVIVANEILFREQMDISTLGSLLAEVRTNLTAKGWNLPVATSDLGDKWTATLAQQSDYIMANIHPFFGGINAKDAASWTYSFWSNHNSGFFKSDPEKNVISEIGWPSQGGTDCGSATVKVCPDASVAGIPQMNQLMEDWVCSALQNGTQYFWFEAFDEPWKVVFNEGDQNWEDQWGLMDVNRKLKSGVKIPDCGGKTIDG